MEALGVASGVNKAVCCFENSRLVKKSASVSASSTSGAECCVSFRASENLSREKKKLCAVAAPLGLSGDGLGGAVRRSGKLCFSPASSSSSSSTSRTRFSGRVSRGAGATVAPVESLEGESSLLKDIDSRDLEAETPLLLLQCSDLDWKKLVDDLRSEALHGLQSAGLRALSLKALEKLMESWIHEQMVDGIEHPAAVPQVLATEEQGWSLETAASNLRMEANLQAAQMLAKGVDSTFDWETDVAELHQRILLAGGAESSILRREQRLWLAWADAQSEMVETSNKLAEEVLSTPSVNAQDLGVEGQAEVLHSKPQEGEGGGSAEGESSRKSKDGKALLSLGAAVAAGLAVEGIWIMDAIADEGVPAAVEDVVEAASRAPSWLVPAVLIFPPLSYFLFNVYRDKVNPYAKVTDWMFGIVAFTIFSNIVLMALWGVRLY